MVSCFNIAIEPLACMLCDSNIQGLHIPGSVNNLITKLFADDTTVYISENDSFNELQKNSYRMVSGLKSKIQY